MGKAKGATEAQLMGVTYARAKATMYVRILDEEDADATAEKYEEAMKDEYTYSGTVYAAAAVERKTYSDDDGSSILLVIIIIVVVIIIAVVVAAVVFLVLNKRDENPSKVSPAPAVVEPQPAVEASAAA